jgi:hypothetical protein
MSVIHRKLYDKGWVPSADAENCPPGAYLRGDNLIRDELGILSLRQKASKVNAVALADTDVHSLYTALLSGTRARFYGAGNAVYKDGTSILSGLAGSLDVAFGSAMGNVLIARSTSKKRHDGTNTLDWGLTAPIASPRVAAVDINSLRLGSGNWSMTEGLTDVAVAGEDGTASGALQVSAVVATGRATVQKTFSEDLDLSSPGKNSGAGDVFKFAIKLVPDSTRAITLVFGVNNTGNNPYSRDYYTYTWKVGDPFTPIGLTAEEILAGLQDSNSEDVDFETIKASILRVEDARKKSQSLEASGVSKSNYEWFYFAIPRKRFTRVGSTNSKGWNTVRAMKIIYEGAKGTNVCDFDSNILLMRGFDSKVLAGGYKFRTQLVREGTDYFEKSPPSPASEEVTFQGQAARLTLPSSVTAALPTGDLYKLYTYAYGGLLDSWYLCGKTDLSQYAPIRLNEFDPTPDSEIDDFDKYSLCSFGFAPGELGVVPGSDYSYTVATSDLAMYIDNDKLDQFDVGPPNNIIGIVTFKFRTFVLTSDGVVWISRRSNPSSFAPLHKVTVCGADESPYWIVDGYGGVYVGTSKQIYRLGGTFDEASDDSLDVTKVDLNPAYPPVDKAVGKESNTIVYRSSTGWRIFNGETSEPMLGTADLLYKGYTRHGVSPVNVASSAARFRCAISKGQFVAITPEGAETTSTKTLHRYNIPTQDWYRHTYPNGGNIRSLHREPDGTIIFGDDTGFVWVLDGGGSDETSIPLVFWTPNEDNNQPMNRKDSVDFQLKADTAGGTLTVAMHKDSSGAASYSPTMAPNGVDWSKVSGLQGLLGTFRRFQLRLTGSFSSFKLYEWELGYRKRPAHRMAADSGFLDFGIQDLVWVREIKMKVCSPSNLSVKVYGDGVLLSTETIVVTANVDTIYSVPVGRTIRGKQLRVLVETSAASGVGEIGFEPYWIQVRSRRTGDKTQKEYVKVSFD